MELSGEVSSGLGRAHVFMAQPHYQEQFRALLGKTAWPGTLNVTVEGSYLIEYIALRKKSGIDTLDASSEDRTAAKAVNVDAFEANRIRGFLRDGVSFGGATAYKGEFKTDEGTIECAILIPDLTRHIDVVEVIAAACLREQFNLEDGAIVRIELD
jgi:CTP-dependent riboflavin kinase